MYAIANVILGTILPWDDGSDETLKLDYAYAEVLGVDQEEAVDLFEDEVLDDPTSGWTKNYHGGSSTPSAFVGVSLHEFDETCHFPLSTLTGIVPTAEQEYAARIKYDALPEPVRAVLPPYGMYVVWSSS
jgi:hypothetical protein